MPEAEKHGYELIVLVIDCDRQDTRIKEIQEAQEYNDVRILRAMGVAVQSFDAWMFADETALSSVVGITVQRQPDPEAIRDAKRHFAAILNQYPCALPQSEIYEQLCKQIQFDVVARRCVKGFAPFLERLERIADSLRP